MIKKNIFRRIFDLNIPNYDEFDYYINLLSNLHKHKDILTDVVMFEHAEQQHNDIEDLKDRISKEIIEYIKQTEAYKLYSNHTVDENSMCDLQKNSLYESNTLYVSIDMNSANYNMLKQFDTLRELGDSYNELLAKFHAPSILKRTKGMRQFIFGNLNPKQNIRLQRVFMKPIIEDLKSKGIVIHSINNDEVIVEYKSGFNFLYDGCKYKIFQNEKIQNFYLQTLYYDNLYIMGKDFSGCDGAELYAAIKTHILNEPLEIRDYYFKQNGKLALYINDITKTYLK